MELKVVLYADDLTLYLTNPFESLTALNDTFSNFSKILGLHINYRKSEIYFIHLTKQKQEILQKQFLFKWTTQNWRHLGIYIPQNMDNIETSNYDKTYNEVKTYLKIWHKLKLTWVNSTDFRWLKVLYFGKICFCFTHYPFLFQMQRLKMAANLKSVYLVL